MEGRETRTDYGSRDCVLLPALPQLLCDFRPSLHTAEWSLRSPLDLSQHSPVSTASWNELQSC